jgi:hypothetical protein
MRVERRMDWQVENMLTSCKDEELKRQSSLDATLLGEFQAMGQFKFCGQFFKERLERLLKMDMVRSRAVCVTRKEGLCRAEFLVQSARQGISRF